MTLGKGWEISTQEIFQNVEFIKNKTAQGKNTSNKFYNFANRKTFI
jgi:hypothetical protein